MYLSPEEQEDDGHSEVCHIALYEKQFIVVFPSFTNSSIEWMKSMKKSSSYMSIYKWSQHDNDYAAF